MPNRAAHSAGLLALAVMVCLGSACGSRSSQADRLQQLFPSGARHLRPDAGWPLAPQDGGFVFPRSPTEPAALVRLKLPAVGEGEIVLSTPDGFTVRVRERGASGPAELRGGTVAYPRVNGTSYWTASPDHVEEWLLVDARAGQPAAEWDVAGGTLRQAGEVVDVVDEAGRTRIRVAAPVAFGEGERPVGVHLVAQGARLAVRADAEGTLLIDPTWGYQKSMVYARQGHSATLLSNGKVLIAGGDDGTDCSASAEIYDPGSGEWSSAASMSTARSHHSAILLRDGKVLIAGGERHGTALSGAELFDPTANDGAGAWAAAGSMGAARSRATATRLRDGRVFVAGGHGTAGTGPAAADLSSTEIFDPAADGGAGAWSPAAAMSIGRSGHTATSLSDGTVLVAGGSGGAAGATAVAEIFDPAGGSGGGAWRTTGEMGGGRAWHSATLLHDGKVLVAGGSDGLSDLASCETFDPAADAGAGAWAPTASMTGARRLHTATLLPSGRIVVGGGLGGAGPLGGVELYDPAGNAGAGAWTAATPLLAARSGHTATLVPSGRVLVAGGLGSSTVLANAELFTPGGGTFAMTAPMSVPRTRHTATLLPDGRVLVAGGICSAATETAEIYDPEANGGAGSWTPVASLPDGARYSHSATLLLDGRVLVAAGIKPADPAGLRATAVVFDPTADAGQGAWAPVPSMAYPRGFADARLLPDGTVFVACGGDTPAVAEIFDPDGALGTGTWTTAPAAPSARRGSPATLLPDGLVLLTGGNPSVTADFFDPGTFAWLPRAGMAWSHSSHTSTLLPSGKVLVARGGLMNDLFAPGAAVGSGSWLSWHDTVPNTSRLLHTATLLPSGEVMIAGGSTGSNYVHPTAEIYDPVDSPPWDLHFTGHWRTTGSMSIGRSAATATLLPNGKVLVAGGTCSTTSSAELFDEGRGAPPEAVPTLSPPTGPWSPGGTVTLTGSLFAGIGEGSSGSTQSSPTNHPLVHVERGDSGARAYATVTGWSASSLTAALPIWLAPGWYWVRVVVNGVPSVARPVLVRCPRLVVLPDSVAVPPRGSAIFSASGGCDAGRTWLLATNASGGSIDPVSGAYTAGDVGGVVDVVRAFGKFRIGRSARVVVGPGVGIAPTTPCAVPGGSVSFAASGGSGTGWAWSLPTNASGATIDAGTGHYVAGEVGGATDLVQVVDSLGNRGTATVLVSAATLSPAAWQTPPRGGRTFVASGGTCTGWTWSFVANASGGTLAAGGQYTAGPTGGVVDVIQALDSEGHRATASITVTAAATVSPSSAVVPPRGSQVFAASGGFGLGWRWSLAIDGSGATIDEATGRYVAGATDSVTDVVRVVDWLGNSATATVVVGAGVSISPAAASVPPGGRCAFTASGGSGRGWSWSLADGSGGSVDAASGSYVAGAADGTTDRVLVEDSLGNNANAVVSVGPGVSVSPSAWSTPPRGTRTFSASGGCGAERVWTLLTAGSGGTVDAATGAYSAGPVGDATDVLEVADPMGNSARAVITVGAAVTIAPASVRLPPRGSRTFTAAGGTGTGWTWALETNASGASIEPSTGAYAAGATDSVTDVVRVADSLGNTATATVEVGAPVRIAPAGAAVPPRATRTFAASGGSGTGWAWSLASNTSGGSIGASSGVYVAGPVGGVEDRVRVIDSLGNAAAAAVQVGAAVSVSPAAASLPPRATLVLSAAGGSGTGWTWSLATNGSQGRIDRSTGAYTAGPTGGATDVVAAADSLGNEGSATISVTAGPSIAPASWRTPPGGSRRFAASGGSGTGWTWSLAPSASGGMIDAVTGDYVAGPVGSVTDLVEVADSIGNRAAARIEVGPAVRISPAAASLPPRGSLALAAAGGSGTGWAWSLRANASGGSIDAATGSYTAGKAGDTTDVVEVLDSLGNKAEATVSVGAAVTISPPHCLLAPASAKSFAAAGGSGTGWTWTLAANNSGATVDTTTGAYTAGPRGGVTDLLKVADSLGNSATATVTVGPGVTVVPGASRLPPKGSQTFSASGGTGTGWAWSLGANASGGRIDATTGEYRAGAVGDVTDVVAVTDSLGNGATATVEVGPGASLSPAAASVAPRESLAFAASGGSGSGWLWSLAVDASQGRIDPGTGEYTAGPAGSATDLVQATDALGNVAVAVVEVGPPVAISPAGGGAPPRGSIAFAAAGGSGTGWAWSLAGNASGARIDAATGRYEAGAIGGVTDVARVVDSLGNTASATVAVGPGVGIAPAESSVPPRGSRTFEAAGGAGSGWTWSLDGNASGGSIDPATGAYSAGPIGGVTDFVRVTDALGNSATATVAVGAGAGIDPAFWSTPPRGSRVFSALGGSGTGWVWSLAAGASGGSLDAATGSYEAGAIGGVTDVVGVTDSLGNSAAALVVVGPIATISPASATVPPRGRVLFAAAGGSGAGWRWSIAANASGAEIDAATGSYTAGSVGGVTDEVRVADSLGNVSAASVAVLPALAVEPRSSSVPPRGTVALSAVGGSGAGRVWSLQRNASGGAVQADTGRYTAGPVGNVTDIVTVVDSLGVTGMAGIDVTEGVGITPAHRSAPPSSSWTFSASGGSRAGWVWSLAANRSGGTIDAPSGQYKAGAVGNVADVVLVVDSLGNSATARVEITAGVSVVPAAWTTAPGGSTTFSASGGSGTGWTWSLSTNASTGSIDAATGIYTAGAEGGADTVRVTDSLGNAASATVSIVAQENDGCGCSPGRASGSTWMQLLAGLALALRRRAPRARHRDSTGGSCRRGGRPPGRARRRQSRPAAATGNVPEPGGGSPVRTCRRPPR